MFQFLFQVFRNFSNKANITSFFLSRESENDLSDTWYFLAQKIWKKVKTKLSKTILLSLHVYFSIKENKYLGIEYTCFNKLSVIAKI